ncbi:MAG: aminotransferase class V-fold PLP-dependent enzyme [Gammaproteobacteria bacterium]|nr:aminotransferase class V-fold PLP-dependent enzyme [Gammaproteobacteria bacterium]
MNQEFQLNPNTIYLNHAAVAPFPMRTNTAIKRFVDECSSSGARFYPDWLKTEYELREMLSGLINAPSPDDISLLKSTSEGLSVVAYGLEWSAQDNIVSIAQEFPSNRIVWESLTDTYGVQVRLLDLSDSLTPEEDLLALCDENTKLLSISSVQYADGFRLDLEQIGRYTRANKILFCVDAIQSLGAIPFDVQACSADFVVADGHKWLLGPEGLALFYSRKEIREMLKLRQFGWHMVQDLGNFDRTDWEISPSGTRFECGSPNLLGIHGLHASLSLIQEIGIDTISRNIFNNTSLLIEYIGVSSNINVISNTESQRRSGIVTFTIDGGSHDKLYTRLMSDGVICALRGGGIRFSPHYYNTEEEIEFAVKKIESLAASISS